MDQQYICENMSHHTTSYHSTPSALPDRPASQPDTDSNCSQYCRAANFFEVTARIVAGRYNINWQREADTNDQILYLPDTNIKRFVSGSVLLALPPYSCPAQDQPVWIFT
eukprot:GFUD01115089.1.p1 GENE.GFUD01115089.1~~GFUD01115089.1.p1  ORF type:complete len:110 (+),score=9.53 GFUD01115089.1:66-395(+)